MGAEKKFYIRDKMVMCDERNNSPTTCDKTLNVRVHMHVDPGRIFIINLPIDLAAMVDGTLESVPVRFIASRAAHASTSSSLAGASSRTCVCKATVVRWAPTAPISSSSLICCACKVLFV